MCWLAAAMLTGASLLAGCLGPESKHCDNGVVCPATHVCTNTAVGCAPREQFEACEGKDEDAPCEADEGAGYCAQHMCEVCTPDIAVCRYPGEWVAMTSPTGAVLTAVWAARRDRVYATSELGTLLSYDGRSWVETMVTGEPLRAITGELVGDAPRLVALDSNLSWYRFDQVWTSPMPVPGDMEAMWGADLDHVFAVGGQICPFGGGQWQTCVAPARRLAAVWGRRSDDVFAVGFLGLIEHYDGTTWSVLGGVPASIGALTRVWGDAARTIAAGAITTGDAAIIEGPADGSTWRVSNVFKTSAGYVAALGGVGTSAFASMSDASLFASRGGTWSEVTPSPGVILNAFSSADGELFGVGVGGVILRYSEP